MKKIILTSAMVALFGATVAIAGGHSSSDGEDKKGHKWDKSESSYMDKSGHKMAYMMMKCFQPERDKSGWGGEEGKGLDIQAHADKMAEHHKNMLEHMKASDTDGDGYLTMKELREHCSDKMHGDESHGKKGQHKKEY